MTEKGIVDKLSKNGFTPSEVKKLSEWVSREKNTYSYVLAKTSRLFLWGAVVRGVALLYLAMSLIYDGTAGLVSAIVGVMFVIAIIEIIAPLKLGAKVFFFNRKNN